MYIYDFYVYICVCVFLYICYTRRSHRHRRHRRRRPAGHATAAARGMTLPRGLLPREFLSSDVELVDFHTVKAGPLRTPPAEPPADPPSGPLQRTVRQGSVLVFVSGFTFGF